MSTDAAARTAGPKPRTPSSPGITSVSVSAPSAAPKVRKETVAIRDGLKVVRLIVPPSGSVPEHHSSVAVVATIVRGAGTFTVAGRPRPVRAGEVKFTPAGGRIRVELGRPDGAIEIRVSDTGRGIEPGFLKRIFAPFSQVEPISTRAHGGLGLGLAISKQLVELHGGTIHAESAGANQGSTFFVRLPLPARQKVAVDTSIDGVSSRVSQASLGDIRVLLVEDSQETRDALLLLLRERGAQVTAVESAAAALRVYEQEGADVIVSDIGLPGEDGYALIRTIRALEASRKTKPVPAVALSAFASEDDCRQALRAGFHQHIGKPVEPEQLFWALMQLSNGKG